MRRWTCGCAVVLVAALAVACDGTGGADDTVGPGSDVQDPGTQPEDDLSGDPGAIRCCDVPDPGTDDGLPGDVTPTDPGTDAPLPVVPYMLVVSQDDLLTVANEWATYRRAGGFEVEVTTVTDLAGDTPDATDFQDAVRGRLGTIRDARGSNDRLFLLLLGDAPAEGAAAAGRIPAHDCENTTPGAGGCWTDNRYADLDGDTIPDVAAGRVPARTVAEARTVLAKIVDFEGTYKVGEWNRRVGLYVGQAGFSAEIDSVLELAMMDGLKRVSHAFDVLGAWDNPNSSYWYMPFNDKVVDLFNQGALMTVYVGHGSESWTQGLTTDQVAKVHCNNRRPFSMFFACYAGNYASAKDSLAETLAFKADGPVASFGSSDVSHPYGNAVLAYESQMKALEMRYPTIGEVIVAIKRGMLENDDDFRKFMEGAGALDESCDTPEKQVEILRQHNDLYNLLGDPATAMQYPREVATFDAPTGSLHSRSVGVSGTTPGVTTGTATVSLETERDVVLGTMATIDPAHPVAADVNANWLKANDKAVVRLEVPVTNGRFQATLEWTSETSDGDYYLKVYARDQTTDAVGVADFH